MAVRGMKSATYCGEQVTTNDGRSLCDEHRREYDDTERNLAREKAAKGN